MPTIKLTTFRESPPRYERWHTCELCGGDTYNRIEFEFTSGSTEPTEGETLTGASSGATGVITDVVLYKGTYAGGDAKGKIEMSTATGVDADALTWGTENEDINGSTGGDNMMTMSGYGHQKTHGILYPMSFLIKRDGKYYCENHYNFKWYMHDKDEEIIDLDDEEMRSVED